MANAKKTTAPVKPKNRPCGECPNCGESDYVGRVPLGPAQEFAGVTGGDNGVPYTHIVREVITCRNCRQNRIVRSYEDRSETNA